MNNKVKNIVTTFVFVAFIATFTIMCVISGFNPVTYSSLEKRDMAQFPADATWGELMDFDRIYLGYVPDHKDGTPMNRFEAYTKDQFPLREFFRYIKSHFVFDVLNMKENNGYAVENGSIGLLVPGFDDKNLNHSIGRLEQIYEKYLVNGAGKEYVCIVPDKGYYFGKDYGYPTADYEALFDRIEETLPGMEYIDITGLLNLDDYYKTDWHWDQKNLLDVLKVLGDEMGFSGNLSFEYTENYYENYHGGYWDMSGLYPNVGEKLTYLTNPVLNGCTVLDVAESTMPNSKGDVITGLYNHEIYHNSAHSTKYDFFLSAGNGGWRGIQIIENPNAKNDAQLIVFRDSFGSSLIPLMAEGYARIAVVDIRSMHYSLTIGPLAQYGFDFDNSDTLFLYSTTTLNANEIK